MIRVITEIHQYKWIHLSLRIRHHEQWTIRSAATSLWGSRNKNNAPVTITRLRQWLVQLYPGSLSNCLISFSSSSLNRESKTCSSSSLDSYDLVVLLFNWSSEYSRRYFPSWPETLIIHLPLCRYVRNVGCLLKGKPSVKIRKIHTKQPIIFK